MFAFNYNSSSHYNIVQKSDLGEEVKMFTFSMREKEFYHNTLSQLGFLPMKIYSNSEPLSKHLICRKAHQGNFLQFSIGGIIFHTQSFVLMVRSTLDVNGSSHQFILHASQYMYCSTSKISLPHCNIYQGGKFLLYQYQVARHDDSIILFLFY